MESIIKSSVFIVISIMMKLKCTISNTERKIDFHILIISNQLGVVFVLKYSASNCFSIRMLINLLFSVSFMFRFWFCFYLMRHLSLLSKRIGNHKTIIRKHLKQENNQKNHVNQNIYWLPISCNHRTSIL